MDATASPKLVSIVLYDDAPTHKINNKCRKIFLPIIFEEGEERRQDRGAYSKKKTSSEVQKCLQSLFLSTFDDLSAMEDDEEFCEREVPQHFLKLTDIPIDLRYSVFLNPDLNVEDPSCFWSGLDWHLQKVYPNDPPGFVRARFIQTVQKLYSLCLTPKEILKRLHLI
jgi:hypothetical protein